MAAAFRVGGSTGRPISDRISSTTTLVFLISALIAASLRCFRPDPQIDLAAEQRRGRIQVEPHPGAALELVLLVLDGLQHLLVLGEGDAELPGNTLSHGRVVGAEIPHMQPVVVATRLGLGAS